MFFTPIEKGLNALDRGYGRFLNWAVRHRKTGDRRRYADLHRQYDADPGYQDGIFARHKITARIGITIELPIGTRQDITRELALDIDKKFREKYPEILISNFTEGTADTDNTFAQLSNNGTHIIEFNINLTSVGDRERGLTEICELMRQDLAQYSEIKKFEVLAGGQEGSMGGETSVNIEIYGF